MSTLLPDQSGRLTARAQVIPREIRGLITRRSGLNSTLPFLLWDVAETGIGLWTAAPIPAGESLVLTVGQPFLSVLTGTVIWCEAMTEDQGYRCGIEVTDNRSALLTMATAFAGKA